MGDRWGTGEATALIFMGGRIERTSLMRSLGRNPVIGVHRICSTYPDGRRLLVEFPLVSVPSAPAEHILISPQISKRWILDRAALKQARAEDIRYVKDPLFFDLFNIFTGNRTTSPPFFSYRP